MMTLDQNGHLILSPADVASMGSAYTNGLRFDIHQTNGQDARLGEITAQGKSSWGGDLVFRTKDANGSPNNTVTERMRILAGGGITFNGDTAAANALNDYEEGFSALTIHGSSSGSTTYAQNDNASRVRYTKIGRLVHASFLLNNQTFPTFAGDIRVNLPFTSSSGSYEQRSGDVYFYNSNTWDNVANFVGLVFRVGGSQSFGTFGLIQLDANRQVTLGSGNTSLSNAGGIYMRINITYETDS
jgi:hypothetical protein